jgi:hypothetical protein
MKIKSSAMIANPPMMLNHELKRTPKAINAPRIVQNSVKGALFC